MTVEKVDGAYERLAERVTDKPPGPGLFTHGHAARSVRLELEQKLAAVWRKGGARGMWR